MVENNNNIKLLLCCSKPQIEKKSTDKICHILQKEIDWDWILKAACYHNLLPSLYFNLMLIRPEAVPQDILLGLQRSYFINAKRNRILTRELLLIIEDLQKNDIEAVPFKGPALAQAAYGDITLRSFSDLDIMVKKQDVLKAKDLLILRGYRPEIPLTPLQEKIYIKSACEYNFARNDPLIRVEIHWTFLPKCFSVSFDEKIWSRLETMNLEGAMIHCFSAEDLILALCGHATKHQWDILKLVSDIAMLMEGNHIDWERVSVMAADTGLKRILHIGLLLAHDLEEVELPEQMQSVVEKDGAAKQLALRLSKKLFTEFNRQRGNFEKALFWQKTRERLSDKARYLLILFIVCIKPTITDFDLISLPNPLYPLYYIIRPIRIFYKYVLMRKQMQTS